MIQTETNFICGTKNTVCCIFVRYIIDLSSTKLYFYSFVRCGCCDLWEAKSRPRRAQNRHTGSSRCKNSYFFYFWGTGLLGYLILGGSNLFYSPSKEGIFICILRKYKFPCRKSKFTFVIGSFESLHRIWIVINAFFYFDHKRPQTPSMSMS